MSAEAIAKVVSDLRHGRVACTSHRDTFESTLKSTERGPVVDVTSIFRSVVVDHPHTVAIYEDHPCITPPWGYAQFCWVNSYDNVYVISIVSTHRSDPGKKIEEWKTAEPLDWNDVEWVAVATLWAGGKGGGKSLPTYGPIWAWQFALGSEGQPLDIHWSDICTNKQVDEHLRDGALQNNTLIVLLQSLNFLNCRNVEIVEPKRERHERKRIERTGISIHTINVFPTGKTTRSLDRREGEGVPLTSVRGHFAHYGPKYNRKLLFGRIEGKFWIPQHARGDIDNGLSLTDYKLEPS